MIYDPFNFQYPLTTGNFDPAVVRPLGASASHTTGAPGIYTCLVVRRVSVSLYMYCRRAQGSDCTVYSVRAVHGTVLAYIYCTCHLTVVQGICAPLRQLAWPIDRAFDVQIRLSTHVRRTCGRRDSCGGVFSPSAAAHPLRCAATD